MIITNVFNYAGTHSLNNELKSRKAFDIIAGDMLIIGGFPNYVVAVSENIKGEKLYYLPKVICLCIVFMFSGNKKIV